jgi:hypothetical protein
MAITTISNMKVYNAEFHTGLSESVAQAIDIINGNAANTIRVVANEHRGDYRKESFWQKMDLVTRRDDTSTSAAAIVTMPQDEVISVKVKRKIGPVRVFRDALVNVEADLAAAARIFGAQAGEQKIQDMLNTGLLACEAALANQGAAVNLDITGETTKTANTSALNRVLAKFGDRAQRIRGFAMHSKPNFDVVGGLLSDKVTGLTDVLTIQGAIPAMMGRLALVSDAPALVDLNGSLTDTYNTLGLVEGAIVLEESDPELFVIDETVGLENLAYTLQAEYAYTITIKGFAWNVGVGGGRNPNDAAIGTGSNWAKVATSDKDLAGVRLVTQ